MTIIQSRLEGVPGNIVDPDAIQFASRKVAAVSGDARRALDICRRAVELAESESLEQDAASLTPSRTAIRAQGDTKKGGRVVINTIKQAISEATSSPLQQSLKSQPLACKLFLAAFLARIRKSGVSESILGDVIEEAKRLACMADEKAVKQHLLMDQTALSPDGEAPGSSGIERAARAYGMGAAAVELMEQGIINLEPRKGERMAKIRLNISEEEVKLALKEDIEVKGLGLSS